METLTPTTRFMRRPDTRRLAYGFPVVADYLDEFIENNRIGWGTWTRTKINGVRVRRSTIELFPNRRCRVRLGCCAALITKSSRIANTCFEKNLGCISGLAEGIRERKQKEFGDFVLH